MQASPQLPEMSQTDLRVFVAVQTLGICSAIEAGAMDVDDARRWLFRPEVRAMLKLAGACQGCIGLVDLGDDVCSEQAAINGLRDHALTLLQYSQG
ncbi:MAG: hypothetical protein AAFV53_21150 [Myxococcota bacterium]